MQFERSSEKNQVESIDGTVIIPKQTGEYPLEAFELLFTNQLMSQFSFSIGNILEPSDEGHIELDLEALALLIWEHRQYCDAQEFSVSVVRIHRVIQELSEEQNRVFPRDFQSHPLTEDYSPQTIRNGLKKLVKEGFVEEGSSKGEYHYKGVSHFIPPSDSKLLSDIEAKLDEESEIG